MGSLSEAGKDAVREIGRRHGFSSEATCAMFDAVVAGGGRMAQFSHPEFGGSGQWMRGGMIMISDMFDAGLKNRVDVLCRDLADLLDGEPDTRAASFQSQRQGGAWCRESAQVGGSDTLGHASAGRELFVQTQHAAATAWWPPELGSPDSAGAQDGAKYAYFARARRLVIENGGRLTVYDTLDHRIGGFAQQQPGGGHASFHSQHGDVDITTLPVVSRDAASPGDLSSTSPDASRHPGPVEQGKDVFADLERLAALNAEGIISDDEFAAKKQELLRRI